MKICRFPIPSIYRFNDRMEEFLHDYSDYDAIEFVTVSSDQDALILQYMNDRKDVMYKIVHDEVWRKESRK